MNVKARTKKFDDEDIIDREVIEDSSSSDDEKSPPASLLSKLGETKSSAAKFRAEPEDGPIACRVPLLACSQTKTPAQEILKTISTALDPNIHVPRSNAKATHTFEVAQTFSLTNQLRDSQAMIETYRTGVAQLECERNDAECRADQAKFMAPVSDPSCGRSPRSSPRSGSSRPQHRECERSEYRSRRLRPIKHAPYWAGKPDSERSTPPPPPSPTLTSPTRSTSVGAISATSTILSGAASPLD
jgi:hypothetical protein